MRLLACLILLLASLGAETLQEARWSQAKVSAKDVRAIDRSIDRIISNRSRYTKVDKDTDVPWYVIAGLHNMESSGSFRHHLHEGSPLTARTKWVPKGRPKTGSPPFTWEYSSKDALLYDKMNAVYWASLDKTLYACERYNGTGYLRYHTDVPTPYLWSGTSIYSRGKYVADGKWSSTAKSGQIGISAIWKRMEERGLLNFKPLIGR
jgi:lysozyme family protein